MTPRGARSEGDGYMFDCLVCSPPYAGSLNREGDDEAGSGGRIDGHGAGYGGPLPQRKYGDTSGQLGTMKPGSPCETPMNEVETLEWTKDECYADSWQGLITPESFAHPAKMARGQLFRLVRWLFETGRVRKGDTLLDPFGGISTTAIAGASAGLKVVTCELEEKFHRLGAGYDCPGMTKKEWVRYYGRWQRVKRFCEHCQKGPPVETRGVVPEVHPHRFVGNVDLHRRVWEAAGDPQPTCLLGDSRKLAEVAGPVPAQCVLSSPPFHDTLPGAERYRDTKYIRPNLPPAAGVAAYLRERRKACGLTAKQIDAALGTVTLYSWYEGRPKGIQIPTPDHWLKLKTLLNLDDRFDAGILTVQEVEATGSQSKAWRHAGGPDCVGSYGTTPGNLGNLPPGDALASGVVSEEKAACVVSSPPYENSQLDGVDTNPERLMGGKCSATSHGGGKVIYDHQSSPGNVGNTSGETFWDAAKQIVEQCHLLLKPGATTCWVVKSYVKAGAIVPFPAQWAALLESTGFKVTHRIRCHLVSETREADLFGGETVKRKERKSFFRRLHEKKSPHTRIDYEEIVVAVKVGQGGSAGAVVSSPPFQASMVESGDPKYAYKFHGTQSNYGHTAGQLGGLPPGTPPENAAH